MASHCYLVGPPGELFVEYLVHHCALLDQKKYDNESSKVKMRAFYPIELRAICEKGLLLLTITIPEMQELFALLVVLLRDPLARDQQATQILMVLYYLSPLFPKNIDLFWQDEKVADRVYVCDKIDWMYEQANISIPANRLGLAKAMGLVVASHLDAVLEKLKGILDNVGQQSLF